MSEPSATPVASHKGPGGFLQGETAGVPNWAWILVVAAGVALAVIVPRLLGNNANGSTSNGSGSATDPLNSGNGSSGLGLAIDPTTGLPLAAEGLVPSGAGAGGYGDLSQLYAELAAIQAKLNMPSPVTTPTPTQGDPDPRPVDIPVPTHNYPTPTPLPPGSFSQQPQPQSLARYVTVTKWPSQYGTLSGIASANGVSLARVEQLNPNITNPNLIYPGQQVRIA